LISSNLCEQTVTEAMQVINIKRMQVIIILCDYFLLLYIASVQLQQIHSRTLAPSAVTNAMLPLVADLVENVYSFTNFQEQMEKKVETWITK